MSYKIVIAEDEELQLNSLVKKVEKELTTTQEAYYNTISSLEKAQNEYNKQKNKYNSISDETIKITKVLIIYKRKECE